MKTDEKLKEDVTTELAWDPAVNASQVGVAVKNGVVTLTGHLDTYAEKYAIERAAGRVEGVKAIAVELDVKLASGHQRSDTDIAVAAESALKWRVGVPAEHILVKVEKGWITLKGEVEWDYQRRNAEKALRSLTGVVGVSNSITLKSSISPVNVSERIREALTRHAQREAKKIEVIVQGSVVTLRGEVDSLPERAAAFGAAWAAPGISVVKNELKVHPVAE
jgi:osmotically-inducible protein OsmY